MRVAVIFGGPSPEHDISILTGLQAGRVLNEAGLSAHLIYWTKQASFELVPSSFEPSDFLAPARTNAKPLRFEIPQGFSFQGRRLGSKGSGGKLEVDVVLNCCHGGPGEDGSLDSMLRLAGLRATGPSGNTSALLMDKLATSAIAEAAGVTTIPTANFVPGDDINSLTSKLTGGGGGLMGGDGAWVAKPRFGGSSLGVEVGIEDVETLEALSQLSSSRSGLLVQSYLKGWIDLNVAVRRFPKLETSAIERPFTEGMYDYSTKYLSGQGGMESAPRELPANIPNKIKAQIEEAATTLAEMLQITGAPRFDFLWDGETKVLFNEINPIPGAFGMYLWAAVGIDRATFLKDLLEEARNQPLFPSSWNPSSDGLALRVASNIASKLA